MLLAAMLEWLNDPEITAALELAGGAIAVLTFCIAAGRVALQRWRG